MSADLPDLAIVVTGQATRQARAVSEVKCSISCHITDDQAAAAAGLEHTGCSWHRPAPTVHHRSASRIAEAHPTAAARQFCAGPPQQSIEEDTVHHQALHSK